MRASDLSVDKLGGRVQAAEASVAKVRPALTRVNSVPNLDAFAVCCGEAIQCVAPPLLAHLPRLSDPSLEDLSAGSCPEKALYKRQANVDGKHDAVL